MSFIWLRWHNGTGHTRGLFALPFWLESHLPFPGHYIIICVEICLRCRIEQAHFPPNKQTKKESNLNQIQTKKERAWYYYYIHTEPIKIKKPSQTRRNTQTSCVGWRGSRSRPLAREEEKDPDAGGAHPEQEELAEFHTTAQR